MSWCLSWSWVYHFFITGRHWFVKMYEKTVAFKRFLNIKVTSLLKYKEKTLQCSDKRCRAMNHQYSRVAWQFWMRARQELQQKVMPRCTLNYYIIIIDFRDMGGGGSFPSVTHASLTSIWKCSNWKWKLKTVITRIYSDILLFYNSVVL